MNVIFNTIIALKGGRGFRFRFQTVSMLQATESYKP